jgi:hypothetical protein
MHFTLLGKQVLETRVSIGTRGLLAGKGTLTCSKLWVMLLGQDLHNHLARVAFKFYSIECTELP